MRYLLEDHEELATKAAQLEYYSAGKLDFVDCILAGYAVMEQAVIHTFDKAPRKYASRQG